MEVYIRDAAGPAQVAMHATGIPASITIAQGALESGWGTSALARDYNNLFGIKANQGQLADHDYCEFLTAEEDHGASHEERAKFAQYATVEECFLAHAQLLCRPHYRPAMARLPDVEAFAWALGPKTVQHPEGCTYSTLAAYHDRLMRLVHQHNLTQYDTPPDPDPATAATKEQAA